jgi:hypothetical protein
MKSRQLINVTLFCLMANHFPFACHRGIPSSSPSAAQTGNTQPQLLYIAFESVRDSASNSVRVRLLQHQVVNGTLKKAPEMNETAAAGNWKLSLLNARNKTEQSVIISNPLTAKMEYIDEHQKLTTKTVYLPRAETAMRFYYTAQIKKLVVEEILADGKMKLLFRQNL